MILPAGTYAHPERPGETLTLGEWETCGGAGGVRWWGHGRGQAVYWFAEGWHAWPPFAGPLDGRDLPRLGRGTGTRDDADRTLREWLQLIDVDGELVHIQPIDPDDDPPFEGSDVVSDPPAPADDLDRLEALAAAATEGPWRAGLNGGIALVVSRDFGPGRLPRQFRADCGHFDQDRADAAFIAEARTAVPALIADVRRLRALVAHQNDDVVETRGALVAVQREIVALAEELEARPVDVPEAVADEIARRLRALVEGR